MAVAILSVFSAAYVLAETTNTASPDSLISQLMKQIETLKTQIAALQQQATLVKNTQTEIKQTLSMIKQLNVGSKGEDVKLLQKILATDPEIYPKGYITGFFGQLTKEAVKKFQQKAGINEEDGSVKDKTLSKINEILKEGAGSSGKVPPGLLIAPGIKKKLGFQPQPLPGQILPPGIAKKLGLTATGDTLAPVISLISAINTTSSSAMISWKTNELANSKVFYDKTNPLVISNSTPKAVSSALVLDHSIAIFDLTASSDYYYVVSSTDVASNSTSSSQQWFKTTF